MKKNCKFITFEGGEGSGKSTVCKKVAELLEKDGHEVVVTREPGGVEIAEKIRDIILDPNNTNLDARAEALLFAASRRQHLVEKVIPALECGKIVLCDRFIDSSLVYQGYTRDLGIENVKSINEFAIDNYMPDLTILLDITPEDGLRRVSNRNEALNRLDKENLDFHNKVREGYNIISASYQQRIVRVDAAQTKEDVVNDVYSIIKMKLNESKEN